MGNPAAVGSCPRSPPPSRMIGLDGSSQHWRTWAFDGMVLESPTASVGRTIVAAVEGRHCLRCVLHHWFRAGPWPGSSWKATLVQPRRLRSTPTADAWAGQSGPLVFQAPGSARTAALILGQDYSGFFSLVDPCLAQRTSRVWQVLQMVSTWARSSALGHGEGIVGVQGVAQELSSSLGPDSPDQTDFPEHGTLGDKSNYKVVPRTRHCPLTHSNSPLSWGNHCTAKRKIPKRLVFAQVSPLGSPFALYDPITLSSMPSLPEWTSQEPA